MKTKFEKSDPESPKKKGGLIAWVRRLEEEHPVPFVLGLVTVGGALFFLGAMLDSQALGLG